MAKCPNCGHEYVNGNVVSESFRLVALSSSGADRRSPTRAIWDAYGEAYAKRYGVPPTRNKRVNAQMSQFLSRVPAVEAPAIAAFYVWINRSFYVASQHSVGLLLKDAEAIRTQWLAGRTVTDSEARRTDRAQSNLNVYDELRRELKDA